MSSKHAIGFHVIAKRWVPHTTSSIHSSQQNTWLIESKPDLSWPPTVEELRDVTRLGPGKLLIFFKKLLSTKDPYHAESATVLRYAESCTQDILYALSKGKFLTAKHVLNGCGLHSLTGQKQPIRILSREGHSITYGQVLEIETAQAELVQALQHQGASLPLVPATESSKVTSFFWWDNFDQNIETKTGHGTIHTTHGEAFQESSSSSVHREEKPCIPRSKRRALAPQQTEHCLQKKIIAHKEPILLQEGNRPLYPERSHTCKDLHLLWSVARYINSSAQLCPRFIGWIIQLFQVMESQKTIVTYLPPKSIDQYRPWAAVCETLWNRFPLSKSRN